MSDINIWPEAQPAFRVLHRKVVAALRQNLHQEEAVAVVINGPHAQAMIGTQSRVFVYKKGFMAGASFGSELTEWNYRSITGVQLHTGMMSGAVVIQASGQAGHKTSYWGQGESDPYKAPNAIPVLRPFDVAKQGVAVLRRLVEEAHRGPASHAPPPAVAVSPTPGLNGHAAAQTPSDGRPITDQLRELADLHNAGALTQEEFAAAKARLLGM